jgi:alpha-ketoglutarate-dependent taurine dioxygenase
MTEEQKRAAPPVEHDVVRVHPDIGRKCLYLGQHASHVAGLPMEEGRALIAMLNAHCTQLQYTFTYRWSVGDAVIWDNRLPVAQRDGFRLDDGRSHHAPHNDGR